MIIERVLGERFAAVVEQWITGPLALDDTVLSDGSTKPTRHGWFSMGDIPDPNVPNDTLDFPHEAALTSFFGSANLMTSSQDLLDWGEALYTGDLLGEEATASMLEMRSSFLPPGPGGQAPTAARRHRRPDAPALRPRRHGVLPRADRLQTATTSHIFGHGGRGVGTRALVAHHPKAVPPSPSTPTCSGSSS